MEVLLTGNTMFLTKEWIEEAFPDDHVLTTYSVYTSIVLTLE